MQTYITEVMQDWNIPGLAFSMVQNDSLIFAQGFGVKELGKPQALDAHSLFQIGSVSKSFTATLIAMLVDENKISWDDSVKEHLPDFEMYDPWVSHNLLIKDIMIHRTGLPAQSGTYIPNMGYEQEDVYQMFRLIPPASSVRTRYAYNNITFVIASKIIEKYMGKPWEVCVQERIFKPLGMNESALNERGFATAKNVGTPHSYEYVDGAIVSKPLLGRDEQALHWLTVIGPAGGVVSNVVDMTKWIRFHLSDGNFDNNLLLSKKNLDYLHTGQTITSQNDHRITLYGHCWFVEQNDEYKIIFHTGTTWGSTALCAYLPEYNIGMVFLSNSEVPASPRYALMRRLADLCTGAPERAWSKELLDEWLDGQKESAAKAKEKADKIVPVPAAAYAAYTGQYHKDILGKALISLENGKLYITVGPKLWKSELVHNNGHDFKFRMGGNTFPIHFAMNADGSKALSLDIDFGQDENFGPWKAW